MNLTKLLPAVVKTSPQGEVQGRKRLQKIVHLLELSGLNVEAEYYLLHYGPFSDEVASVTEDLVYEGVLAEDVESIGAYRTFQYVYRVGEYAASNYSLDKMENDLVSRLGRYSTVDLEVASTIGYFEAKGRSREKAIEDTKLLKPSKTSNELVMKNAVEILRLVKEAANKRNFNA